MIRTILIDGYLLTKSDYSDIKILRTIEEIPDNKHKLRLLVSLEKWVIVDVDKRKDISKQVNKYLKEYIESKGDKYENNIDKQKKRTRFITS